MAEAEQSSVAGVHPLHRVPPEDEELQRMSLEIEA